MTREEFIKQRCEIDKITLEEFEEQYRVVECNCGQPYCKGYRCLDLDGLLKENQELKQKYLNAVADYETTMAEKIELEKQLEDKEDYINKLQAIKDKLNKWDKENAMQQKEFIKYLEDEIKLHENDIQNFSKDYKVYFLLINDLRVSKAKIEEILQKCKKIMGVSDESNIS